MSDRQFTKGQFAAEAFVVVATLLSIVACAVAWNVF
jgi:hypothetical protein